MVVESCGADFSGFIKEIDSEQTALSTLIMPFFDFGFISHANSDRPSTVSHKSHLGVLVLIRGESFNRVHSDVSTDISNARYWELLRRSGLLHLLLLALLGGLLLLSLSIHIRPGCSRSSRCSRNNLIQRNRISNLIQLANLLHNLTTQYNQKSKLHISLVLKY